MITKVGGNVDIISSPDEIYGKKVIIMPGVGAFDYAIQTLTSNGWIEPLYKHVIVDKKIILGICLGMQIMTRGSEEGSLKGLGFIDADTVKFNFNNINEKKKIPHMGWNKINVQGKNNLFETGDESERFYFANSYHVVCDNDDDILTTTQYGYNFTSAYKKNNIIGVQFHPEKSHKYGCNFFEKFIKHFST